MLQVYIYIKVYVWPTGWVYESLQAAFYDGKSDLKAFGVKSARKALKGFKAYRVYRIYVFLCLGFRVYRN